MEPTQDPLRYPPARCAADAVSGSADHSGRLGPEKLLGPLSWSAPLTFHWRYRLYQRHGPGHIIHVGTGQTHALASVAIWCLPQALARSVGFGPVMSPQTALTEALATTARLQSRRPAACKRSRQRRRIRSHTPASCQSHNRRQQVIPLPQPVSWGKPSLRNAGSQYGENPYEHLSIP